VIEEECRLFLCARCQQQVTVCRACDDGQVYCAGQSRALRRREGMRRVRMSAIVNTRIGAS
jgi:hypothetical protein